MSRAAAGISWLRLRGLLRKETLQIRRDASSIAIAFVLPLLLLLLFGYGVSLDAREVPLAIVVEGTTPAATSFAASFASSPYFAPRTYRHIHPAEEALVRGEVEAILWLRQDFGRDLLAGTPAGIGVFLHGSDANQARLIEGYLQGAWARWLAREAEAAGRSPQALLRLEERVWFNPAVSSRDFLVPGLLAVIMTMIGALLTALVLAREWERGTMEALMATPVKVRELLLGKLLPYFVLGMGGLLLSVAVTVWLFHVPLRGSFFVLLGVSAVFLFVALSMGLLISTLARNQMVAGQLALITTFLPAFILSGFIFDIGSMPAAIRIFTRVIAARYYVAMLQTIFLAGTAWREILENLASLIGLGALIFFSAALVNRHKRLS